MGASERVPVDWQTCSRGGGRYPEVLQWARGRCPWDERTSQAAAGEGHLEVLKWAHQDSAVGRTGVRARRREGIWRCWWARENGCPLGADTCANAARRGDLEMLRWARQNGSPEY